MALTQSDISQIRNVVREEVKGEVQVQLEPVHKDIKEVKKAVKKIEKNVDVMAKLLDAEDVKLAKRVGRIEEHLELTEN